MHPVALARLSLACSIPLLAGCNGSAPSEAPTTGELARFDFEESGWKGKAETTRDKARTGAAACRLAAGGYRSVSAWSPHIELDGTRALECRLWTHLERLDGGALTALVHFYESPESEHPAIPAVPHHSGRTELFVIDAPERDWTEHACRINVPPTATSLRLELRLRPGRRVEGLLFVDDVVLERSAS